MTADPDAIDRASRERSSAKQAKSRRGSIKGSGNLKTDAERARDAKVERERFGKCMVRGCRAPVPRMTEICDGHARERAKGIVRRSMSEFATPEVEGLCNAPLKRSGRRCRRPVPCVYHRVRE